MAQAGEVVVKLRLDTSEYDAAIDRVRQRLFTMWAQEHPIRALPYRLWARVRRTEPWRLR